MKDKRTLYHAPRALALALTMLLTLGAPARAGGLFDWLLGPAATEAAAVVTLPPADRMPIPQDVEAETPVPEITLAPIPEAALKDDGEVTKDEEKLIKKLAKATQKYRDELESLLK